MSVPVTHAEAVKQSSYTPQQWDEFERADETKGFRRLRLKHDLHIEEVTKKFANVESGETLLSFALVDEMRNGMLRLYQLADVYGHASTQVGEKWLAMAGEVNSGVTLRVGEAEKTLARILAWVKRTDGNSDKQ